MDIPQIKEITAYVVITGVDNPCGTGEEKILLLAWNKQEEPLALGNLYVHIDPKALNDVEISTKLSRLMVPIADEITVPLVTHCLKQIAIESVTIDRSEIACLIVPSGGPRNKRNFHLKIACVIPVVFLPPPLGIALNRDSKCHWWAAKKILNNEYRLFGGPDEDYLTQTVLRAYLTG